MDAERESPSGSPVIEDSVRGTDRELPVHAVIVEAPATAYDLVPIYEALPTPGAMAGGTMGTPTASASTSVSAFTAMAEDIAQQWLRSCCLTPLLCLRAVLLPRMMS